MPALALATELAVVAGIVAMLVLLRPAAALTVLAVVGAGALFAQRLLNARLALMSRQPGTAVADLTVSAATIDKYFDGQSRKTQLLQSLLKDVSSQCTHTTLPRPDDTLASLAAVAGGR